MPHLRVLTFFFLAFAVLLLSLFAFLVVRHRLPRKLLDTFLQLLGGQLSLLEGSPFDAVGERQFRGEGDAQPPFPGRYYHAARHRGALTPARFMA